MDARPKRTKRCADPGQAVSKQLYGLAVGCAEPNCTEPLVKAVQGRRTLNTRIAHIRASSPSGPRADPYMSCDEVNHFDNLVVLCLFHAIEIDEHPEDHPIELLEEWKARQHEEAQVLGTTVELTEDELDEAVQAVSQANASSTALVDLAKAVRAMRTVTERNRRDMSTIWARRDAAVARLQQSMAGQMWDAETGETIDVSGVRLSRNEETQHRDALVEALNKAHRQLEPAGERILEEAAGLAASMSCPDGLEAWIERAVRGVVHEATLWSPDEEDRDRQVRTALDELDESARAFRRAAAGAAVDIPPPPEPPAEPEPTAIEVFVAEYTEFYEDALRFTRVDHLSYDDAIHERLLDACPTLLGAPDSMHFMTLALTATQNALLASAVCRNATDEEFNELIRPRLAELGPEAAAALHLRYLRDRFDETGDEDRVATLNEMLSSLGQTVLDEVGDPDFWKRNQWYGHRAVDAAALAIGDEETAAAISAAIDAGCTEGVLLAFAPVTDSMDGNTRQYMRTERSYRPSSMPMFADWFPTATLVSAVQEHRDSFSTDEARELAAQLIANPQTPAS